MNYQRQIDHFDGIVEIETISAETFHKLAFDRKIDQMVNDALEEIDGMVKEAKGKIYPKPIDHEENFRRLLGSMENQQALQANSLNFLAMQQDLAMRRGQSWVGALGGGIFGVLR